MAKTKWNEVFCDEQDCTNNKRNKKLAKEIYDSAFWIKALINQEQAKLVDFMIP